MSSQPQVTESEAAAIACAMRQVAKADGDVHPDEVALIATFASGISSGVCAHEGPFADPEVLRLMLNTTVAVALADGKVSAAEREVIMAVAERHGATAEDVAQAIHGVASSFFQAFQGVRIFRDQAIAIAAGLGLSADEATRLLDAPN
jgi:uncharacterized membrane protein YebE (DUF533 family)